MDINPISGNSSGGSYPSDWGALCNQMGYQIQQYRNSGQITELGGYLSTMIQFTGGFGSITLDKAMTQLYNDAGGNGSWQVDLANVRALFPANVSPQDIVAGLKEVLTLNTDIMPGEQTAEYMSGLQTSLNSILLFASPQDRKALQSLQEPLDTFIANPDETNAEALSAVIKNCINEL
jgi:hypothetical protein